METYLLGRVCISHEEKPSVGGVRTQTKHLFTFNHLSAEFARIIPNAPESQSPHTFDRFHQGGGTPKSVGARGSIHTIVIAIISRRHRRHHEPPRTDPVPHSLRNASAPPSHQP